MFFYQIRYVIDEFNTYRNKIVVCGPAPIIDELISPFEGMENTFSMEGIPAKVKMVKKQKVLDKK